MAPGMYSIGEKDGLYRIDAEGHGEAYPGWRTFADLPYKLKRPFAMVRAISLIAGLGKLEGIGEQISPNECHLLG